MKISILRYAAILLICISISELLFISPVISEVMAQPPTPPCAFYGRVYVGGTSAQDGLEVKAVIAGTALSWNTTTKYGNYTNLIVPSDDPDTPGKDGAVTGDQVKFYVQGTNTNKTATWFSFSVVRIDLSIPKIQNGTDSSPPSDSGSTSPSDSGSAPSRLPYTILIVIAIAASVVVLLSRKRGYRLKVTKQT